MNIFEGVEFNSMQFAAPIIILITMLVVTAFIYKILFRPLPKGLYNLLIGPLMLFVIYIWAIPMKLGFHTYFS